MSTCLFFLTMKQSESGSEEGSSKGSRPHCPGSQVFHHLKPSSPAAGCTQPPLPRTPSAGHWRLPRTGRSFRSDQRQSVLPLGTRPAPHRVAWKTRRENADGWVAGCLPGAFLVVVVVVVVVCMCMCF